MNQADIFSELDDRFRELVRAPHVAAYPLKDDGVFPNNENLALLVYQGALALHEHDPASLFEALFEANQWGNSWRNGVYGYHYWSR
jgi:uncharacterized protein YjlB